MSDMTLAATEGQASGLQPLEPRKKGDAAYHSIRRSILLGHIKAGDYLTEQGVASELTCSQGTVREALFKLEQDGLVQRRGYRGTVVSATSVCEAVQMVRIRILLESTAFETVSGNLSIETRDQLKATVEAMDRASQSNDPYLCSELDRQFHMAVMRGSGALALEPILTRCSLHIHRFTYLGADLSAPDVRFAERHQELLEAVSSGNPPLAVAAIRRHIEDVIRTWAPELMV